VNTYNLYIQDDYHVSRRLTVNLGLATGKRVSAEERISSTIPFRNGIINNRFVDVTPFSPEFSLAPPQGSFSNPYLGHTNPYPAPFPPPANSPFPAPVRQLLGNWLIRSAYVASHASHLMESLELNPSLYTPGSKLSTDQRRAFQPFGSIQQATQDINSNFQLAAVDLGNVPRLHGSRELHVVQVHGRSAGKYGHHNRWRIWKFAHSLELPRPPSG
jgi:hypothetical protein